MKNNHPFLYVRVTGISLIIMAVLAIFANGVVLNRLVIPSNPSETINNIISHDLLFRSGIASFVLVVILDVIVSWTLYVILKPISQNLALLSLTFRLVYSAIFGSILYTLLSIHQLVGRSQTLNGSSLDLLHNQITMEMDSFQNGWLIGLVFFGVHLLIVGVVIFRSENYLPRFIGVLLIAAFVGYATDSLAHIMLPSYVKYKDLFLALVAIPGVAGELSLALWLLIKGVNKKELTKKGKLEKISGVSH